MYLLQRRIKAFQLFVMLLMLMGIYLGSSFYNGQNIMQTVIFNNSFILLTSKWTDGTLAQNHRINQLNINESRKQTHSREAENSMNKDNFGPPTDTAGVPRIVHNRDTNKQSSCYQLTRATAGHFILGPKPEGRLGNHIFQFVSTLGIAATLGYKPIIKPTLPLLKTFNINHEFLSSMPVTNVLHVNEKQWRNGTWRKTTSLQSYNLTIDGLFQSWKYFSSIDDCVRDVLMIKPLYMEQAKQFLRTKTFQSKTVIGIHVRRTDMLTAYSKKIGRVVAEKSYLSKAMEYFRSRFKNTQFIVCSDDMKWSKANIIGSDVTFSIFKDPITDLSLLSLCDHVIITVGTFGWWGGWLSGGTVVYLSDFPQPGSQVEKWGKTNPYTRILLWKNKLIKSCLLAQTYDHEFAKKHLGITSFHYKCIYVDAGRLCGVQDTNSLINCVQSDSQL